MKLKGFLLRNRAFIYKWLPILILIIFSLLFFIYGYLLANKRYNNYEYGKFDLGNMSQMVWNSSRGNFMEITDQFGTNMPRWGMSHVDPLLLIFVPIFLGICKSDGISFFSAFGYFFCNLSDL